MTMRRKLGSFVRNSEAAVAVEFALLLPFMLTLLFGGIEVTQGVTARRKVALASSTMSDLVGQAREVTAADVDNVFVAGSAVLTPFNGSTLRVVVSSIQVDANGIARVAWSRAKNRAALVPGTAYTLPAGFPTEFKRNSSFIVTETAFDYTPVLGQAFIGALNMVDTSYALPRVASTKTGVPCRWTGCPTS